MECPKCKMALYCLHCTKHWLQSKPPTTFSTSVPLWNGPSHSYAPICADCGRRHKEELKDVQQKLGDQQQRHKEELKGVQQKLKDQQQRYNKQRLSYEELLRGAKEELEQQQQRLVHEINTKLAVEKTSHENSRSRITERLGFLKLECPDPREGHLRGDVTFIVQGGDVIRAHSFILEQSNTADIEFTEEVHTEEVLKIAHKYQIFPLKKRCAEELCGRIDESNVAEMLRSSKFCDAVQLHRASVEFFKENFDEVYSSVAKEFKI